MSNADSIRKIGSLQLGPSTQAAVVPMELDHIIDDPYWNPGCAALGESPRAEFNRLLRYNQSTLDAFERKFSEDRVTCMERRIDDGSLAPFAGPNETTRLAPEFEIDLATCIIGLGKNGKRYEIPISTADTPERAEKFRERRVFPRQAHDDLVLFF